MELRVLGGVELVEAGAAVALGGPKQRLLLAVLLAHRREVVSLDLLADAMWGEERPPTARATLQTHLSKLRRRVGGAPGISLDHRPPGYVLDAERALVDADRFEAALAEGRSLVGSAPHEAVRALEGALALWRGPAFAEFADEPWARAEAVHLEELRLVANEERVDALLAAGEHGAVVGELEALVAQHPLRERLWAQLMLALHRSGRQAEALRTAQALRRKLGDEMGLEPSTEVRELEQAIAADDPSLRIVEPAGGASEADLGRASSSELPAMATALVGRAQDLDGLAAALAGSRLLTLTGPGGVGKSSLAIELARREGGAFSDGVRVVELASVRDGGAVTAAVAQALDVERRLERSLEDAIVDVLGPRQLLVVLDNCEHVIEAVGRLVQRIVRWCPEVRLLTTSREPIGMAGESVWPVAPLGVPSSTDASVADIAASPAVQMLTARAAEAAPSFRITEDAAPAIAELCIQLDGVPLALELAAARMSSMGPRQLAERLHERFSLLGSGHARDPRHRTLRDVVQWSYELLPPTEQVLFDRLSVFAGGFDLESAEQACGVAGLDARDVALPLAALVDKSLVSAERVGEGIRYRQLETLRQYGGDRLATRTEGPLVRRAHVSTFVALAIQGGRDLDGPDEAAAAAQLDREFGNLRAAVATAIDDGDAEAALTLIASVREHAFRRIRYEIVEWAERAARLDRAGDHPLLPAVLGVIGYGSFVRGELDRAVELAEAAIDARTRLGVPSCALPERVLGNALFYRGDRVEALSWMDRMVDAALDSGVAGRENHALYMRSVAQTSVGDPAGGAELAERAADAAQRAGSETARSQARYAAALATASTDPARAVELLDASAEAAGSVGNRWMRAFALTEAMWLRARRGEAAVALRGYREVVETWYRGGDWANQWLSVRQLAGTLATKGSDEDAALLFGAVDAAGATSALPLAPSAGDELRDIAVALEARLGPDAMARARRRGGGMRDDVAVRVALEAIATITGE